MNSAPPALALALRSLEGLSLGDAFGELFFRLDPEQITEDRLPPGHWAWTDDTHMALSIVEILRRFGTIDQDELARAFARRFLEEPHRGYGGGAYRLLEALARGVNWRERSPRLFGFGSYGNGAAMRAAPIGAYFHADPARAAREAYLSAEVTHAHPEGQAGAIAVAVAASLAATRPLPAAHDFLRSVLSQIPEGETKRRTACALDLPPDEVAAAAEMLGTGFDVSAQDTVPFCLWSAAHHLSDYRVALWSTVRGRGDCDTTCAIVGGIVALSAEEIPADWLQRREPLGI